jgi:hypothetical protein
VLVFVIAYVVDFANVTVIFFQIIFELFFGFAAGSSVPYSDRAIFMACDLTASVRQHRS